MRPILRALCLCALGGALLPGATIALPQEPEAPQEGEAGAEESENWDTTLARGDTREIDFTTSEGTWMSVDVSPDGQALVFDLLANVYRLPIGGGTAECLTCDSGVATNYHPTFSPDGSRIAFISDRGGQDNLWVMNADGSEPTAVFDTEGKRAVEPAWTADGEYLVVRQRSMSRGGGGGNGIFLYHRDGGTGVELLGGDAGASWPEPSADGRWLYFQAREGGTREIFGGAYQLRRLDLRTGDVLDLTQGLAGQQVRNSSGGAFAPALSPDGRWLAFGRRVEGTISHKGHEFGPRTALWLRDLATGAEHKLMDPIEQDMTEGMKVLRILPGYSWDPEGASIVIAQGGKLRRLWVDPPLIGGERALPDGVPADGGVVQTIPFTARVQRTVSEMARASFRIEDGPFRARFLRWYAPSPATDALAFQAVGRIWRSDLGGGAPVRVTPVDFEPFEFAPAWSPDGAWIAYASWDDERRGHLWKVPAAGGEPVRLSDAPGEFLNPSWSPDGAEIVVARGSGATARGRSFADQAWFELVRYAADGSGEVAHVAYAPAPGGRSHPVRPQWERDGRIYFVDVGDSEGGPSRRELVSVLADGDDRRVHVSLPYADDMAISPDGRHVAFQEGDNVFVTPVPRNGTAGDAVALEKKRGALPVTTVSERGGLYPSWIDADTVAYGSGPVFYTYDLASGETTEHEISLQVPRAVASGTVAFTGARIVTLENREVIDRGDLVITDGRIACVGECETADADRVVDATGKTIVPGFVDMHAHHYREHSGVLPRRNYEQGIYLAYGVTTNLDNSMWSQSVFSAAELIEAGGMVGPRTFSTGDPLYGFGDGARQNELTSYEVAEDNILRLKSWGATAIKQYLQPNRDQRQWVSDIARREGLMVTSEGSDLAFNMGMIMDGQTAWEHPMSYMPIYSDAAKFFGRAGAVYSPTFIVGGPAAWNEEFFFADTDLWRDPKQRRWLPWRQLLPHTRERTLRPATDYSYPLIAQAMADIMAEGGHGAIGSHGQQHGIGSHWEIWMAAAALGPHGALEVASREGAWFLGALDDLGTIAVGKLGDVLVLDSNPLEDIRNTLDIRYVVKAGEVRDGATLDEVWPNPEPYGDPHWFEPGIWMDDVRPTDVWDRR